MLKCPGCGHRVSGADLLAGVCSQCNTRLSLEIEGAAHLSGTLETIASDDADSRATESATHDSVLVIVSSDEESSQVVSFDGRGPATLGGESDSDMLIREVHASSADSEVQTVIGNEQSFLAFDDFGIAPDSTIPEIPAGLATGDLEDDARLPGEDDQAALRTYSTDDVARREIGHTFETEADRRGSSAEIPESIIKTIESAWDLAPAQAASSPQVTLRGQDSHRLPGPRQTLVIKLRSISVGPAPKTGAEQAEYELREVLGEGGMGIVYEARQTSIDREVALKMLKPEAAKSERQRAKFLTEAVVTGELGHPNIVPIYDVGAGRDGSLFYSMKRVRGRSWLSALKQKTLDENLTILMKVCDGIAYAHAKGVIHRDLKPENVMLGEFGEVLVMDWGLAQSLRQFRKRNSISHTQTMGGTPAYMAPEMATGPVGLITPRSDVYLLGAILFEILAGVPPHHGKTAMRCLMAAARNEIVSTKVGGELMAIARRAMSADPGNRYESVVAFQAAIREYQSHSESIAMTRRAADDLVRARETDDYQDYAHALFGFQEAVALWPGNAAARDGVSDAQLAYAHSAARRGDYDLAVSLLGEELPDHRVLRETVDREVRERRARQLRLDILRRTATLLMVGLVLVGLVAFILIRKQAREAELARDDAANSSRDLKISLNESREAQEAARAAEAEATAALQRAQDERENARSAQRETERARAAEEQEAYRARIGLAAAKVRENDPDAARGLLERCAPGLRNWEWGWLAYVSGRESRIVHAVAGVEDFDIDPAQTRLATAGSDGAVRLWDLASGRLIGQPVPTRAMARAVKFSPDGRTLAVGSMNAEGYVQLWDPLTGLLVRTFCGHREGVVGLQFSRDGRSLLTASFDGRAVRWDVDTGRPTAEYRGHSAWVWSARFAPDESQVVTASQDETVVVWDAESAERVATLAAHRGPCYTAAFSPDGRYVAASGYEPKIVLWSPDAQASLSRNVPDDLNAPVIVKTLTGHQKGVRRVEFSSDGRLLLSSSQGGTARLWDLETETPLTTFRGHEGEIRVCKFGPGDGVVYTGGADGSVREWMTASLEPFGRLRGGLLGVPNRQAVQATFAPDAGQITSAGADRALHTWEGETGEETAHWNRPDESRPTGLAVLPVARRLLSSAGDNVTRIWNLETGVESGRLDHTGRHGAIAASADGRWLATGSDTHAVRIWRTEDFREVTALEGHAAEVQGVELSADGALVLSVDVNGNCRLSNRESGAVHELGTATQVVRAVFHPTRPVGVLVTESGTVRFYDLTTGTWLTEEDVAHPAPVVALALSPDGRWMATGGIDGCVRVWDLPGRTVVREHYGFSGPVRKLDISSDSQRLVTADGGRKIVQVFNLETGQEWLRDSGEETGLPFLDVDGRGLLWEVCFGPATGDLFTAGGGEVQHWDGRTGEQKVSFRPTALPHGPRYTADGRWIASIAWDNAVEIWDAASRNRVARLERGHTLGINSVEFAPDGQRILTAGDDGEILLWDWQGGKATVAKRFSGHRGPVHQAVFSRDGSGILSASEDQLARLWDAATGDVVHEYAGHAAGVLSAAFSPDESRVITGSADAAAIVWDVDTGAVVRRLTGHSAAVTSVAYSPDGRRAVTASRDRTAKIWEPESGNEILTLAKHHDELTSASFSGDGRAVLTSARDGISIRWPTRPWLTAVPDRSVAAGTRRAEPTGVGSAPRPEVAGDGTTTGNR